MAGKKTGGIAAWASLTMVNFKYSRIFNGILRRGNRPKTKKIRKNAREENMRPRVYYIRINVCHEARLPVEEGSTRRIVG